MPQHPIFAPSACTRTCLLPKSASIAYSATKYTKMHTCATFSRALTSSLPSYSQSLDPACLLPTHQVNGQDVRTIPAHILQNLLLGPLGSHVEITFRPHSSPQAQVLVLQVSLWMGVKMW